VPGCAPGRQVLESELLPLHRAGIGDPGPARGLRLVCDETQGRRFQRHRGCSEALQAGIEALGLELLIAKRSRLNSVVGICIPEQIAPDRVRSRSPAQGSSG